MRSRGAAANGRPRARRALAAALAAVLGASAAAAQELSPVPPEQAPARTLTWDDCVALALSRNPDLAAALAASEASRASFRQSFNGLMPSVTLANSYASGNPSAQGAGRASYTAQAGAAVSLFDMGKISSVRAASSGLDQALASQRQASANLRLSLRQAYDQVLFAQLSVDVARQISEIRRQGAEMVTLRYESGHEYKGNMMNAKAQYLQSQADLAGALRQVRSSRRSLDRQLGLDDFEEVSATGTLAAADPPAPPARMSDFIEARPDVALQEAVLRSARISVSSARSPLWPSLTADYSRSRSDSAEFPSRQYGWTAGATLSYPLFGGGPTSTYFAVQAAERGVEKSQADLRATRDAAVADLESSWAAYATAVDSARVSQALLESDRQRNLEADVRYTSGLLTFDNWELIVSERVSAELQAVSARLNAVNAQAAWEKSLGRVLGE